MPPHKFYAVDLEFIKCRGAHHCRSIAFVPFTAVASHRRGARSTPHATGTIPTGVERSTGIENTASGAETPKTKPCRTRFSTTPVVLSIHPSEVMRVADVLPSGHALLPLLEKKLVSGGALASLKAPFLEAATQELEAYREVRKAIREHNRATRQEMAAAQSKATSATSATSNAGSVESSEGNTEGETGETEMEAGMISSSPPVATSHDHSLPTPPGNALSPQELQLRKELQLREAIAAHYDLLDPFSIPNVRQLRDLPLLQNLYDCPVDSAGFASATHYLSPLRAYGKGKGPKKALSFLLRYHPTFLQSILRQSFTSAADFTRFLEECASVSEATLQEAHRMHQDGVNTYVDHSEEQAPSAHDASPVKARPTLQYTTCKSLEDFSRLLNETWSGLLHGKSAEKFFAYGNADGRVLHTTLSLSCMALATGASPSSSKRSTAHASVGPRFSPRALAAGRSSLAQQDGDPIRGPRTGGGLLSSVPSDVLLSPFQARVLDVTVHPLFTASGFSPHAKRAPPLSTALAKAASKDQLAERLVATPRPHDPLWDAQALACVCVGAGIVR